MAILTLFYVVFNVFSGDVYLFLGDVNVFLGDVNVFQVMLTYLDDVVGNFVLSRSAAYMCVNKLNSLSEVNSVRSVFDWGNL